MTVQTQSRLYQLDAIRGFALLGILFLNVYFFNSPTYGYPTPSAPSALDISIDIFASLFLETRFISLFSMLFGAGLLLQYQQLEQKGKPAYQNISSRLKWLIVIGFCHSTLIWSGDILLTYAVCAYVALHYRELQGKALIYKGSQFVAFGLLLTYALTLWVGYEPFTQDSILYINELAQLKSGYFNQLADQLMMTVFTLVSLPLSSLWYISGLMLIGMGLFKHNIFEKGLPLKWLKLCVYATVTLFIIDMTLQQSSIQELFLLAEFCTMFGGLFGALIYLHCIVQLCSSNDRCTVLQKVGRLSLTLYLSQSIVGVFIFRYCFPQTFVAFERIDYILFALLFSAVQILFAWGYFKLFKQGPMEKLWRTLAWGKKS